ncbi:MAG: CHASE3 domain-containing protein, partial [Edaphobacter sp.]
MNLNQFKSVLRQVFLLPVVALLVVAGALYLQIRDSNATVRLIQESDARISQATLVSKLIVDEESGLRGYETTGDSRFLEPFTEAETHVQKEIQTLSDLSGANATLRRDITDLQDKQKTWRDAFALPVIALVQGGGKTSDVDLNLHGKALMDAVRQDLNDIIHDAELNRTRRIALWHRQVHSMLLYLLFLALGMGVLIGLFTRNRLHAVSDAYSASLQILGHRAEELFQSEQELR